MLWYILTYYCLQWSYGVTLWEVMTLAQSPYPGVDNQDILVYLKRGRRLAKPDECPQTMFVALLIHTPQPLIITCVSQI